MKFYRFSVESKEYGPFFGTVTSEDIKGARTKVAVLCETLNIKPTTITVNAITRVPQKVRDLAEYFSEPRIGMAMGEGTIAFNY